MAVIQDDYAEGRILHWRNEGLSIIGAVAKHVRSDIIATSNDAYKVGEHLSNLELWSRDVNNLVDKLNELIANINAS